VTTPRCAALALAALAALSGGPSAPARAAERVARVEAGGCAVSLEEREHEPVLMLRPGCALELAPTVDALGRLLAELFPERRIAGIPSLSLGRMESLPWLAARLAAAARRSPGWDVRTGRPRAGSAETFVGDLLRREALAREAEAVLASFGVRAEVASVEKVLVRDEAGERVPFDAVVWLRLHAQ
jgi:hypothetical protein